MQTISNLPVFTGTIPNKASQSDNDFANNIFGFINYMGNPFVEGMNDIVNELNILSGEINTTAENIQNIEAASQSIQTALALLDAGTIDDVTIATNKAYSNQKINQLFSLREDKLGANIASASAITIGTAGLGNTIHITGTTTITSLGVASAIGIRRTLIFNEALTLTHNGTFLICPNNENIVTIAGTVVEVVADNLTVWRVLCISHPSLSYTKMGFLSTITSDLQNQLNSKAPLESPSFTGTPILPTDTTGTTQPTNDNSTKLATTAFVANKIAISVTPPTSSEVGAAIAGQSSGGIGTYAFLIQKVATATMITAGSNFAGSNFYYSGLYESGGYAISTNDTTSPAGTWKAMSTPYSGTSTRRSGLFLRIA